MGHPWFFEMGYPFCFHFSVTFFQIGQGFPRFQGVAIPNIAVSRSNSLPIRDRTMNEVRSQKKSKKEGEKEPRSQITPRKSKNKIRVTLVRLLWRAAAPGLKPLRLPRAQRSCKLATQPLPTKEAAKLA